MRPLPKTPILKLSSEYSMRKNNFPAISFNKLDCWRRQVMLKAFVDCFLITHKIKPRSLISLVPTVMSTENR